jgi:hypothetical protein
MIKASRPFAVGLLFNAEIIMSQDSNPFLIIKHFNMKFDGHSRESGNPNSINFELIYYFL